MYKRQTHSREEALKLSDRIVVMDNGKITECVTPREIFDREESVEAYKDGVKAVSYTHLFVIIVPPKRKYLKLRL